MSNTTSKVLVAAVGSTAIHTLQQNTCLPSQAELFYFNKDQDAFTPFPNQHSSSTISDQAKAVLFVTDLSEVSELEKAITVSTISPNAFKVAIVIAPEHVARETVNSTLHTLGSTIDSYIILTEPAKKSTAVLSVTEAAREGINILVTLITEHHRDVMVDFEDLKYVLASSKKSLIAVAEASGPDRVKGAVKKALTLPFMPEVLNEYCKAVLLNITSGNESSLEMEELTEITESIQEYFGDDAEVIFGHGINPELEGRLRLEIVASVELAEVCNAEVI